MKEARVYADGFQTTFANVEELMHFLKERAGSASWIRKPTKDLRLVPLKKMDMEEEIEETEQEILNDTKNHTKLMLKMRGQTYPVRDCAILFQGGQLLSTGGKGRGFDKDCGWKSVGGPWW